MHAVHSQETLVAGMVGQRRYESHISRIISHKNQEHNTLQRKRRLNQLKRYVCLFICVAISLRECVCSFFSFYIVTMLLCRTIPSLLLSRIDLPRNGFVCFN